MYTNALLLSISFFVLWLLIFFPEQVYLFDKYIDTHMAKEYNPEKFDQIHLKMDKSAVLDILGEPLYIRLDTTSGKRLERYIYTSDGKIFYKKMPWYMANDYAWYRSSLKFNAQDIVVHIDKGWSCD